MRAGQARGEAGITSLRNLKLTLEYDGTDYVGWQRQPNGVSIQALVEDALAEIDGAPVAVHGAGRTDAGVHALRQVASAVVTTGLPAATIARALNAVLPGDVRVRAIEEVDETFHARFSARGKIYEYRIVNAPIVSAFLRRHAWHIQQPLDLDAMRAAARPLVGTHDFAAFQGAGSVVASTERTLSSIEILDGVGADVPIVIRFSGSGFLRHMVRNIAGTLVEVGIGRWPPEQVTAVLASRDRTHAGPTAPPHGLFLCDVTY